MDPSMSCSFYKLFLGGIVVAGGAFCAGPDIYLESSGVGGVKYLIDIQIVCGLGAKELGHKILIKLLLVFIPKEDHLAEVQG